MKILFTSLVILVLAITGLVIADIWGLITQRIANLIYISLLVGAFCTYLLAVIWGILFQDLK